MAGEDDNERDVAEFAAAMNRGQHWQSHLCSGIASSAVPCMLQILVVAAHYYAVAVVRPSISSSPPGPAIFTPVHEYFSMSPSPSSPPAQPAAAAAATDEEDSGRRRREEEGGAALLLTILSSDPATMLYDAAHIMMKDRTQQQQQAPAAAAVSPSCNAKSSVIPDYAQDARLIMLPYTLGIVMLPSLLVPSLLVPADAFVPGMGSSRYGLGKMILTTTTWPLLNACILCFLASWGVCLALFQQFGLYKLSICCSMHLATRILMGLWSMLYSCPLAPVFMPRLVAWGVGITAGLLLLCISHVYYSVPFTSLEFYMCHVWASGVVAPMVQSVLLLPILHMFKPAAAT